MLREQTFSEMTTIRNTTLEFLIKCRRKGVRLIFIGEIPSLVEARKDGRVKRLAEECICISESFPTLLGLLDQDRDVKILKTNEIGRASCRERV